MADIVIQDTYLADLLRRASELASAVDSLANIFEERAALSNRQNQVARLKEFHSIISQRMERAREVEMAASAGHGLASAVGEMLRLGAGLITMTSEDETMQTVSRHLLTASSTEEAPYGTVLVQVVLGGVPEGVDIVNISCLARESKRDEREVVRALLASGNLLFTGEAFSRFIDGLADRILRGELSLPISTERISELQERRVLPESQ